MKKSIIAIIVVFFCYSGQAQILRSIANSAANQAKSSAANKASEKVDKEVDKGVNKFFDNLMKEDSTAKPTKGAPQEVPGDQPPAGVNNFMKRLGVSTEVPVHKELYKFSAQIVSLTEGTDDKGKATQSVESTISFDETTSDAMFKTNTKDNATTAIIDQENKCMIMLSETDGQKTGFATKFDPATAGKSLEKMPESPATEEEPVEECKMTKTGNSKTISGFSCSEYRCETSKEISIAWITKDFAAKNNKIFGNSAMGAGYKTDGLEGMVIRYELFSKTDKSSSTMTIKTIDMKKSSTFSLAGYQITGFSINQKK